MQLCENAWHFTVFRHRIKNASYSGYHRRCNGYRRDDSHRPRHKAAESRRNSPTNKFKCRGGPIVKMVFVRQVAKRPNIEDRKSAKSNYGKYNSATNQRTLIWAYLGR